MNEFLFERNRHLYLEYFHLDEKKFFTQRITYTIIASLALIFFIAITHKPTWAYGVPILAFVVYKYPYFELMAKASVRQSMVEYEFISFLRYFIALLSSHGNVYQTLHATFDHVQEPIKSYIKRLINHLNSPTIDNRDAFLQFAEEINTSDATLIMELLYQFTEDGIVTDEIRELENTIHTIEQNRTKELIEKKVRIFSNNGTMILVWGMFFLLLFVGTTFFTYFDSIDVLSK